MKTPGLPRFLLLSFILHALVGACLFYIYRAEMVRLAGGLAAAGEIWLEGVYNGGGQVGAAQRKVAPAIGTDKPIASQSETGKPLEGNLDGTSSATVGNAVAGNADTPGSGLAGHGNGFAGAAGDVNDPRFLLIRRKIEAAKIYPSFASQRGITGTARVRFRISDEGRPLEARVIESSGSDILDEATLRTLNRAAPFPPVTGWLTFPLRYELEGAGL